MKIVFLDVDGVCNGHDYPKGEFPMRPLWVKECIDQVNRITDTTGAKIVISSAWRYILIRGELNLDQFKELFKEMGITGEIIGSTCSDEQVEGRDWQIYNWLIDHKCHMSKDSFVVLDDIPFEGIAEYQIKTDPNKGLTLEDADKAINLLNNGVPYE